MLDSSVRRNRGAATPLVSGNRWQRLHRAFPKNRSNPAETSGVSVVSPRAARSNVVSSSTNPISKAPIAALISAGVGVSPSSAKRGPRSGSATMRLAISSQRPPMSRATATSIWASSDDARPSQKNVGSNATSKRPGALRGGTRASKVSAGGSACANAVAGSWHETQATLRRSERTVEANSAAPSGISRGVLGLARCGKVTTETGAVIGSIDGR